MNISSSFNPRKMFAKFVTGVCILLIKKNENIFRGLTINSFSSVSLDPLFISFSIKSNSQFAIDFDKSEIFSINILAERQKDLAKQCSVSGGSDFSLSELAKDTTSYIPDCLVSVFCQVQEAFQGGDHTIFLCKVLDMKHHSNDAPLVFFNSSYCALSL